MTTTATHKNPYRLVRPCPHCPFRSDIDPYLRADRAREIAASLREGAQFSCHQTTEPSEDGEDLESTPDSAFCAGALITMEKEGYSGQQVRIAERLGVFDADRLDMKSPVHDSLTDWVRSHGDPTPTVVVDGETLEYEHCGVVGPDCVDPAGYGGGGGVWENDEEPTCHPVDDSCNACGSTVCSACRSGDVDEFGQMQCLYCAEDDDE